MVLQLPSQIISMDKLEDFFVTGNIVVTRARKFDSEKMEKFRESLKK